ncbi:tetra-peptide repeat homeobox protein 1-like [Ischnura elegans]|uniref:tetra-peptide repeat homeobox protein 1-like n=1 Tax=Ischnura elegans TaxID=197161 RepID=UPI001ED877FD|nr:tetra-peptide repeat homeobox protein 1-like [Ischnura elegans]
MKLQPSVFIFVCFAFCDSESKYREKRSQPDLGHGVGLGYGGGHGFGDGLQQPGGVQSTGSSEQTITVTKEIIYRVPQPYPVTVENRVPYPVPNPVPYAVNRPYPVHVPRPYAVTVDRPYPVTVERPIPYIVRVPVRVPVPRPYAVHIPRPYPVEVPQPVPVLVPHPVIVNKPVPVVIDGGSSPDGGVFNGQGFVGQHGGIYSNGQGNQLGNSGGQVSQHSNGGFTAIGSPYSFGGQQHVGQWQFGRADNRGLGGGQ